SIEQNLIHTDKQHKKDVIFQINLLTEKINETNNFDTLINDLTIKLSMIIFLLLGDLPHNWSRKSKTLAKTWKLNKYRTLKYIITERKKTLLVFNYLNKNWSNREKIEILEEMLTLKMNSNYKEFNKWFKRNHPEIYYELFEF
ncbi:MAG TPA: hypothetical protein VKA38_02980, partial [Draconibacterium sp.]|nr:hypothetical protein [Draconibacterium sp.]